MASNLLRIHQSFINFINFMFIPNLQEALHAGSVNYEYPGLDLSIFCYWAYVA